MSKSVVMIYGSGVAAGWATAPPTITDLVSPSHVNEPARIILCPEGKVWRVVKVLHPGQPPRKMGERAVERPGELPM